MVRLGATKNQHNRTPSISEIDLAQILNDSHEGGPKEIFSQLDGQVIDMFAQPEQRREYQHFRAANLGALAYNAIGGELPILNAGDIDNAPKMHFGTYPYVARVARTIAHEGAHAETQFPADVRQFVTNHLGLKESYGHYPSIIVALEPKYDGFVRASDEGAGHGVIFDGIVTLEMIDHRSREVIKHILADVGNSTVPDSRTSSAAQHPHQSASVGA